MTKVNYTVPEAGVPERQLKLLRPYLLGDRPREDGEWDMFCPLHEDTDRSSQLNIDTGLWYCFKCEEGGTVSQLIRKKDDWFDPPAHRNGDGSEPAGRYAKREEEVTPAMVAGWHAALMANEALLDDLQTLRGLWTKTLIDFEIGWDGARKVYTIPVYDAEGTLLNVRRYNPRPPEGQRKMKGVPGHNHAHLYPIRSLDADPIIICEGEWDCLATIQYGFAAITRTASAQTWKGKWNKLFKGKRVYVCHDMDKTGQEANRKVARALASVADVREIRLPYPVAEKGGKDLSDYWAEHDGDPDEFRRLLEEAAPFDADQPEPEEDDADGPQDAAVLDSFDARRVGRPLRLTVTVKGRREPGYSIPRKVHYTCSQDAGTKCENCPLFERDGDMEKIIPGHDPLLLDLIDAPRNMVAGALQRIARVPGGKCDRLTAEVEEYQSVEVLFARPSVDQMNGAGAGDYKNIKVTSVGRHDTMPNQTVQVVGALYPSPKSQLNEFLGWDIARMETSLDRFELDAGTIKTLKRFQSGASRPIKKLREIADDLSANVTRIYGRPEMHAVMDLAFHSVISFNFAGKRIHRGWLDVLIIGDTRTGKSEAATRLARHFRAGEVVSCETASVAGILGGLQQFGANKEWAITWGAIPLNDRRLVVLDEAGGLDPERIAEMSSVRSSGVAELNKIQTERTYARTRLIWIANPRNARMADYTYGVQAIRPLIGNNEDIARFDLAFSVAAGEVPSGEINRHHAAGETIYPSEDCATLLRWVWSRSPDQVVWAKGAERAVFRAADALGRRYIEDPPLIQVANVREKVARLAVALAARTFSTDETCERIVVTKQHVRDVVDFIDQLYNARGFGYAERSRELIMDAKEAKANARDVKVFLHNKRWLAKFLRSTGKFRRQDLEEVGDIDREEANGIISWLIAKRMVVKDKGDVKLTPTLHDILREIRTR